MYSMDVFAIQRSAPWLTHKTLLISQEVPSANELWSVPFEWTKTFPREYILVGHLFERTGWDAASAIRRYSVRESVVKKLFAK